MPNTRFHVLLNAHSGTALALELTAETLTERFKAQEIDATIDADDDQPLTERIQRALATDAEVIVAAGGDGTATALADAVVGTDKTLAILPLGTANLLARDLSLPLEVDKAIAELKAMQPKRIDVGEVNGRVFLHKVVLGFIPSIAAGREQIRGRNDLGAKIGFLRFFFRRITRARRVAFAVKVDENAERIERLQALAVANNAYDEGFGQFFSRGKLDGGELSIYRLKHLTVVDLFRLTAEMFIGRWREDEAIALESAQQVTIRTRKKRMKVMMDGEVITLETPLSFRIRPLALSVMAPLPVEEVSTASDPALVIGTP